LLPRVLSAVWLFRPGAPLRSARLRLPPPAMGTRLLRARSEQPHRSHPRRSVGGCRLGRGQSLSRGAGASHRSTGRCAEFRRRSRTTASTFAVAQARASCKTTLEMELVGRLSNPPWAQTLLHTGASEARPRGSEFPTLPMLQAYFEQRSVIRISSRAVLRTAQDSHSVADALVHPPLFRAPATARSQASRRRVPVRGLVGGGE